VLSEINSRLLPGLSCFEREKSFCLFLFSCHLCERRSHAQLHKREQDSQRGTVDRAFDVLR
jgi:hypothetical protein